MKIPLIVFFSALIIFGAAYKKSAKNPDSIPETNQSKLG